MIRIIMLIAAIKVRINICFLLLLFSLSEVKVFVVVEPFVKYISSLFLKNLGFFCSLYTMEFTIMPSAAISIAIIMNDMPNIMKAFPSRLRPKIENEYPITSEIAGRTTELFVFQKLLNFTLSPTFTNCQ